MVFSQFTPCTLILQIVINTNNGILSGEGWISTGKIKNKEYIFDKKDSLNMSLYFDNFDVSLFNRYFPYEFKTGGFLSGEAKVNGKVDNLYINISSFIINPLFDKISGENISGQLIYQNSNLYLKSINFLTKNGEYTASGVIPINLNLIDSDEFNINELPIDLMITGQFDEFELSI